MAVGDAVVVEGPQVAVVEQLVQLKKEQVQVSIGVCKELIISELV